MDLLSLAGRANALGWYPVYPANGLQDGPTTGKWIPHLCMRNPIYYANVALGRVEVSKDLHRRCVCGGCLKSDGRYQSNRCQSCSKVYAKHNAEHNSIDLRSFVMQELGVCSCSAFSDLHDAMVHENVDEYDSFVFYEGSHFDSYVACFKEVVENIKNREHKLFSTVLEAFGDYREKSDVIGRIIALNSDEVSVVAESPIEVGIPKRPTRKRAGGKRKLAQKEGYCYLRAVPKKQREEVMQECGYKPKISTVSDSYLSRDIIPRHLRVEFISTGAHYRRHYNWPSITQWSIISVLDGDRRIGAEDWTAHDEQLLRDCTFPVNIFDDFSEDIAEIEAELEPKHRMVKGEGLCWTKLSFNVTEIAMKRKLQASDYWNVTVNEVVECVSKANEKYKSMVMSWVVKVTRDDEDDFHIDDVQVWFTYNEKPEGYMNMQEFVEHIAADPLKSNTTIGAPSVSCVDKATSLLTTPDVRSAVEKILQPVVMNNIENSRRLMPYHVKEHLQSKADELSLPWSQFQAIPHPHALHAGIRRWALMEELPKHIKCNTTIIGMKQEHFDMLRRKVPDQYKLTLVNAIVDAKDISRYAGTKTLSDEVFNIFKINDPAVYFDEQGHYLSAGFLKNFKDNNPQLVSIGFSSIYPLEALEFETSPDPEFVQWEIVPGPKKHDVPYLIYIPEEDYDGKYIQLHDPTPILMSEITDNRNLSMKGGVVAGKSHYRISFFSTFNVLPVKFLVCAEYNYMKLPEPFFDQPKTEPIRVDNFLNLFLYAKVITAKREQNITGKLRLFAHEKKIYFPPSSINMVIKVVEKLADIDTVPDMMARDVHSLGDEIHSATIGTLIRFYKRHTTIRRARKNARLVDFKRPLFVFPTITAVVSSVEGEVYGVKWKPNGTIPGNFWDKFTAWCKILSGNVVVDKIARSFGHVSKPVALDANGNLIFPHLASSEFTYRVYGAEPIRKSQVEHFRSVYEDVPKVRKNKRVTFTPKPRNVEFTDTRFTLKKVTPLSVANLRENWQEDEESEASDESDTSSIKSSSSSSSGVTTPEEAERTVMPIAEIQANVETVEGVCSFVEYVRMGGFATERAYQAYAKALIAAEKFKHPEQIRVAKEIISRTHFVNRVVNDAGETNVFPAQVSLASKREMKWIDVDQARALEEHRKVVVNVIPEVDEPDADYEKRKEAWTRFYRGRPDRATFAHQASGATYWDVAYAMSSDRRHNDIPYSAVVEYPNVSYPLNDCVIVACASALKKNSEEIYFNMLRAFPAEAVSMEMGSLPLKVLDPVGLKYNTDILVVDKAGNVVGNYGVRLTRNKITLCYEDGHLSVISGVKSLVIERVLGACQELNIPVEAEELKAALDNNPLVSWSRWHPERKRANQLARAYRSGEVGVLEGALNEDQLKAWDAMTDHELSETERYMTVIMGDPGCRKSSPIQALLRQPRFKKLGVWIAIMATRALQDDYRDKVDATGARGGVKLPGDAIPTLDRMLAKDLGAYIGFTDENKYPKGYHALLGYLVPVMKYVVFMCDPWQSSWHNPVPCSLNDPTIMGEAEYYMKFAKGYVIGTWRFAGLNADFWRMPSFCKKQGGYMFTDVMPTSHRELMPLLPHLSEASIYNLWQTRMELYASHYHTRWAEQLRAADAFSFAGSQGKDASLTIIEIDDKVVCGSNVHLIYTAMTRSQYILFVRKWRENGNNEASVHAHPIFRVLEHYRKLYRPGMFLKVDENFTVSIRDISFPFPEGLKLLLAGPIEKCVNREVIDKYYSDRNFEVNFVDPDEKRAGARLYREREVLKDEPTAQAFIDTTEHPKPEDFSPEEFAVRAPRILTTLPVENEEMFKERLNGTQPERMQAELNEKGMLSSQFPDTYMLRKDSVQIMSRLVEEEAKKNGGLKRLARNEVTKRLLKKPDDQNPLYVSPQLYNWGASQRNDDAVTYIKARKQRIRYVNHIENQINYDTQAVLGDECWDSFRRYMGWTAPFKFDFNEYEFAVQEFQFRRGERSDAEIKGSLDRADMPYDRIKIAIKQQLKIKDRLHQNAKPGQPIMTHSDSYLFHHGPYGIYFLKKFMEYKPDHFYFHATKTIEDYELWNAKYMAGETLSEMTDMTGQDGTTQGWALRFMENLFKWFSLPQDFIEEYSRNKKSKVLVSGLILAIMTGSGEIWTLLTNSLSATALECFKYNIPFGWPVAGTGDDSRRKTGLSVSPAYERYKHLDPTIIKRFISPRGEFISFMSVRQHVFKDPIILLKRFLAKIATGSGDLSVLGYYDLWKWNYMKGEVLFSCFTAEEMEAHQLMTRIMFNLRKYDVNVKPKFAEIGIYTDEVSAVIYEDLEKGTLSEEIVNDTVLPSLFDMTMSRVTLPFNVSGSIEASSDLALMM